MKKLAIIVSIPPELKILKRILKSSKEGLRGGVSFVSGKVGKIDVEVASCSMGPQSAERYCESFLDEKEHCGVLVLGFCGGLSLRIKVGDVIIPDRILNWENDLKYEMDLLLIEDMGKILVSEGYIYKSAPLLTENHVVQKSDDRIMLYNKSHAEVVDMESFAIVKVSRKRHLPVNVVKVVIDDYENDLPDFNAFIERSEGLKPENMESIFREDPRKGKNFTKNLKKGGVVLEQVAPLVISFVDSYWRAKV